MDKVKKLVEQVESCFPEETTSSQVIDVATHLLVKAALCITSDMTIAQTEHVGMKLLDHVCKNMMVNIKEQIARKHVETFFPRITNEGHLN